MRRRVYEVIRNELPNIPQSYDVAVMIFSSEVLSMSADDLTDTIRQLFEQAELYK